jgi:hypothetical protein
MHPRHASRSVRGPCRLNGVVTSLAGTRTVVDVEEVLSDAATGRRVVRVGDTVRRSGPSAGRDAHAALGPAHPGLADEVLAAAAVSQVH